MGKTSSTAVGFDCDLRSIKAVKLTRRGSANGAACTIDSVQELSGNFVKDEEMVAGLKKMHAKVGVGMSDTVVSCVAGKQTYVAQIPFKRLPEEEMKNALKLEIRKSLPFEVAGSVLDYQILPGADKKSETVQVMVTAVANILLSRHLRSMEKAGLKPGTVDVLPLAVANAFWATRDEGYAGEGAHLVLHIGPEISTLVIESHSSAFYNRTIYFSAGEMYGDKKDENVAARERERRVAGLVDEITRSLAYYENSFHNGKFTKLNVLGDYAEDELVNALSAGTGLPIERLDLAKKLGAKQSLPPGKFDVAIALAMR